ncbi:MAG: hypothetical protein O7B81_11350 [Gammaproteobacteria bacterium]|nr:hypothetical protein [Gammaproteobacteria bacterium]
MVKLSKLGRTEAKGSIMDLFLWIGSAIGAALGFLHGVYLYRKITARASAGGATGINVRGLYYAIWTFALWTLFGSYVLAFWLVGGIGSLTVHLIPKRSAT